MTILLNLLSFRKYHISAWKKSQNTSKLGWGENILYKQKMTIHTIVRVQQQVIISNTVYYIATTQVHTV